MPLNLTHATTPVRGIIFDMDGVLCDSEAIIAEAACRMFAVRYQTEVKPSDFHPFIGTGEDRFLGGVAEQYGIQLSLPGDKELTYQIYLALIPGRLKALPGVLDFIAHARRIGIRLAVATSADRIKMLGNLQEIGLPMDSFDACVSGSEVARKKPFPDLFLKAAEKIGLPPGECLVVEDAVSGIQAARTAGARALGITSSLPEAALRQAGAQWVAPDLAHLPSALPIP